ncbi:DUF4139 domain-containing protein [Parvularcula sp. IMCC14364]|uniref:DUF4139 domain-containing protein n=1 Tax=Parvularcula sp. IMCC14364 TaxID=3067902 RepID=UPI00274252BC|nr:DUF4139 domain-containing protein [Parvularcula sp. IMCC14364]
MKKLLATASLMVLTATGTAALADDLAITIYNNGLALVEDERTVTFPNGRTTIELPGVSSQINAPTVTFQADSMSIVEQNFDFDLLTPAKLMEKAVGEEIEIVRINPGTGNETRETAKVLSVNNGVVVEIDDRIEILRDDNLPTRVIFDGVPENLRARPTLSVMVDSDAAGDRDATLTYLTGGLSWRADYVLLFNEAEEEMDLQGWATLGNTTDTTFENVRTQLVAGGVGAGQGYNDRRYQDGPVRSGGMEAGNVERIGDNYLYTLPGRTTIASKQTKQVGFVDATGVDAAKKYEYLTGGFQTMANPVNADVRIAFSNSRDAGLGAPLPQGIIRVYAKDAQGRAQFIGEDNISHVAGGSDISLKIGSAFDVTVQSTQTNRRVLSRKVVETSMKYVVRNARPEPVTLTLRQSGVTGWRMETEVTEESLSHRKPDANSFVWDIDVPAEGETELTFTMRQVTR